MWFDPCARSNGSQRSSPLTPYRGPANATAGVSKTPGRMARRLSIVSGIYASVISEPVVTRGVTFWLKLMFGVSAPL